MVGLGVGNRMGIRVYDNTLDGHLEASFSKEFKIDHTVGLLLVAVIRVQWLARRS